MDTDVPDVIVPRRRVRRPSGTTPGLCRGRFQGSVRDTSASPGGRLFCMNESPVLEIWCELQCPDCRSALDDVRALRSRYGGALEIRLRHFPLAKHNHAYAAAQAAEEAFV